MQCREILYVCHFKRFTVPVNVLEQLLGGVVTPSVIIDLLPGHEGYTVSLSNHGGRYINVDIIYGLRTFCPSGW